MTYAFTHMGDFLLLLLLSFGPQGQDLGLLAEILTLRLRFGPQDWDLGLETGIWASRLGFEGGGTEKEEEEKEKIPHMCESIGHRPLRGRCPAPPSTSTTTYLGRARVPLTI